MTTLAQARCHATPDAMHCTPKKCACARKSQGLREQRVTSISNHFSSAHFFFFLVRAHVRAHDGALAYLLFAHLKKKRCEVNDAWRPAEHAK